MIGFSPNAYKYVFPWYLRGILRVLDMFFGKNENRTLEEKIEAAKRQAREEGRNEAKAEYAVRLDALMKSAAQRAAYEDLNLAMHTVGIACLAYCSAATAANMLLIREAVFGLAQDSLPTTLRAAVAAIENGPPNLPTAAARAHKIAPGSGPALDAMVSLVVAMVDEDGRKGLELEWINCRTPARKIK